MAYQPTDWEHGDIITGGKLNKIEQELTHVADNATYGFGGAQLSSDGLTPFSYINAGDPMPANPKKGDTVFLKDGNDFLIYSYNGEDWVLKIDPDLSNRIEESIKTASDNTDKAIADNNTQINETINQVAKEQADLAVKDGDFNNKAQAMADKALSDAKANTATVAKSTLDTANQNIADAKKSVTDDIAQEASDRATAVSALDTKAQGYANDAKNTATDGIAQEAKDRATAISTVDKNAKGYADQAKSDAVDAATNADGVINKKIDDTASSITSTVSQNKKDADGKITTAQSTATQALNGLYTKVEKTEYNQKTGDLSTQLNTTTATATQSKQDIIDIKSSNNTQDSKINSIISDATKTQQSISDIKKSQGTQSDKLNQITTDVNGTKQNITDIQTKDGQQDTRMGTIESSVSGVRSDFSTYQKSNDGAVKTAQTTAQTAVDGLSNKVSQTDYNAKTGQLSTDVTNVTQTANQAKTDIASIKQTDTKQDARMTTIEADADGTKTTVSNLQTVQGQQSGSISTLQQRADGFDATVTKVNSLAVGGRNLLVNSKLLTFTNGNNTATTTTKVAYDATTNMWHITSPKGSSGNAGIYFSQSVVTKGQSWSLSFDIKGTGVYSDKHIGIEASAPFNSPTGNVSSDWTRISSNGVANGSNPVIIYFNSLNTALDVYIKLPKLESGNIPTDWTPAPEDVDSATAKAQLTADQATTALNAYKTNADGRITKAQSDITQTAKDVTTKVSQTDYNAKTGDLDTRVTKAQTTADGVATTVGAYKTSNDNRVKATETSIAQHTKDITLRATTADLDSAKKDYNAQIAQVKVNADSITSQVSSIQTKINSMGQVNQLANTEFNPDMSGWYGSTAGASSDPINNAIDSSHVTALPGQGYSSSNAVLFDTTDQTSQFYARLIQYVPVTSGTSVSMSWYVKTLTYGTYTNMWITFWDKNGKNVTNGSLGGTWSKGKVTNQWDYMTLPSLTNISVPDTAVTMRISMESRDGVKQLMSRFMVVFDSTAGDYVPGAYNSNDKVAVQQVTIDGITDTVSKQGTNIDSVTKRVTTAEGTLSTATNNISGLQSSVTQTANQIKTEITDRTKGDANTLQSSKDFTTSSITSYDKGVQTQLTQTANGIIANIGATNLFANSEFTQDYGWRTKNGTVSYLANQNIDGQYHGIVRVTSTAAAFQGYWLRNIPVRGGAKYSYSTRVHFTNNNLTNGTALMDVWFVKKDGTRINQGTGGKGKLYTAQIASPYWVDLYIDGSTAPNDAVYAQVSLIVNNAGSGMTADFTMPTFTATDVHQPYTPNDDISFQLGLFKDNWSIGITDNIGKITSGIVGNASQMSLISKNVTIDSPNTQIKGTAWINSAMIANGAIGSAQIGDATITSAKIATLDVAKLTGNVSNFIQSNWNGLYQSVKISPIGMTITTKQGSTAQFNQDGLVLDGSLGTTNVLNGQIELISSSNEYLGTFQHETMPDHSNVDYLMIKLAGWHTSNPGDSDYDLNSDSSNTIRGGDGIGFGVTNSVGTYDMKMSWDSSLVAGYKGRKAGWHVEDIMTWHQPTYFEGGFDVAQQFGSGDRRALHIQGSTLSNKDKWYGFFDTGSQAGFGTTASRDVVFYVAGKSYSLYTMLHKLNMYQD